jgi:hypothetical protein
VASDSAAERASRSAPSERSGAASPDPVRDEAQRLVNAALAAAAMAARGLAPAPGVDGHGGPTGGRLATGSPECCVCPICRVIAAMREPDPDLSMRLAAGAGDLAAGIAGMLRALATPTTHRGADASYEADDDEDEDEDTEPWRAATTGSPAAGPDRRDTSTPPKPMAKKAVKKAAKKAAPKKGKS